MKANPPKHRNCNERLGQIKFYEAGKTHSFMKFEELMKAIAEEHKPIYEWIQHQGPLERWTCCHDGGRRFGCMTTNMSESFNNVLRGARGMPITTMILMTFLRLNKFFVKRREAAESWNEIYVPTVHTVVTANSNLARSHTVTRYHQLMYQVEANDQKKYLVKFEEGLITCTCGYIIAMHVPCSHVLAVCSGRHANVNTSHLVSPYYEVQMYREAYKPIFVPIPDVRYWPDRGNITMKPPQTKRPPGRPKSTRIRNEMDEHSGRKVRCGRCGGIGHNRKRCKEPI